MQNKCNINVNINVMIYKLTLKDHLENFTSGQGHDPTGKGYLVPIPISRSVPTVELNTSEVLCPGILGFWPSQASHKYVIRL